MSFVAQGFCAGILVGSIAYFATKSNIWAQYDVTSHELSRFNLAVNPKHIVDEYKVQQVPIQRDWVVNRPNDAEQSIGRKPSEAWNHHVAMLYKEFAFRAFNKAEKKE
jgi:hypothetical protein